MSFYDSYKSAQNADERLKALVLRSNSAALILSRGREVILLPLDTVTTYVVDPDIPVYKCARASGFEPAGTVGNTPEGIQAESLPGADAVMTWALTEFQKMHARGEVSLSLGLADACGAGEC